MNTKGFCERCLLHGRTRVADHAHHRVTRARGGPNDAFNLVGLCAACHTIVHGTFEAPFLAHGAFRNGQYQGLDPSYRAVYLGETLDLGELKEYLAGATLTIPVLVAVRWVHGRMP